uniref:Cytosolic endo-beta-N-acetylglucosaminidase TIM barrel domain-containing protein n=1 Tax=Palpitomonas bilix TaxID=652834 RepID=A0A7S3DET9_9EUKA
MSAEESPSSSAWLLGAALLAVCSGVVWYIYSRRETGLRLTDTRQGGRHGATSTQTTSREEWLRRQQAIVDAAGAVSTRSKPLNRAEDDVEMEGESEVVVERFAKQGGGGAAVMQAPTQAGVRGSLHTKQGEISKKGGKKGVETSSKRGGEEEAKARIATLEEICALEGWPTHSGLTTLDALYDFHGRVLRRDPSILHALIPPSSKLKQASKRGNDPRCKPPFSPLVMHVHDMKGGYQADKYFQGACMGQGGGNVPMSDASSWYCFKHWGMVDVFVYFSHDFVTVPPRAWIETAHRHGVRVLGTVITEHEAGAKLNAELFSSGDNMMQSFAQTLVDIADKLGFDGWLINIEAPVQLPRNPSPNYSQIGGCYHIAQFLSDLTRRMHERNPQSQVIWYDSIDYVSGRIAYMNELGTKNGSFFAVCDGILCNYQWDGMAPARSAIAAGRIRSMLEQEKAAKGETVSKSFCSPARVYMGIDVHGRGSFGGGGFGTPTALAKIKEGKVSAGIFAPAWTLENFGFPRSLDTDTSLWSQPGTDEKGKYRDAVSSFVNARPVGNVPFSTSFALGMGSKYFYKGKLQGRFLLSTHASQSQPCGQSGSVSFYSMGLQHIQPSSLCKAKVDTLGATLDYDFADAYFGSNCIRCRVPRAGERPAAGNRGRTSFHLFSLRGNRIDGDETVTIAYKRIVGVAHIGVSVESEGRGSFSCSPNPALLHSCGAFGQSIPLVRQENESGWVVEVYDLSKVDKLISKGYPMVALNLEVFCESEGDTLVRLGKVAMGKRTVNYSGMNTTSGNELVPLTHSFKSKIGFIWKDDIKADHYLLFGRHTSEASAASSASSTSSPPTLLFSTTSSFLTLPTSWVKDFSPSSFAVCAVYPDHTFGPLCEVKPCPVS